MTPQQLAAKLEESFNGHMLHIDLDRQQIEMICSALRAVRPEERAPQRFSMTTVPGAKEPIVIPVPDREGRWVEYEGNSARFSPQNTTKEKS